jgi:hypothetical protein
MILRHLGLCLALPLSLTTTTAPWGLEGKP